MSNRKKNLVTIFNMYWDTKVKSGGEELFLQLVGGCRDEIGRFEMITSVNGVLNFNNQLVDAVYIKTPEFLDVFGYNFALFLRTIYSLRFTFKKCDFIYTASDFFPDVVPAFFMKISNKNVKWIQVVCHLYPSWKYRQGNKLKNIIGQCMQKLSLHLSKRADYIHCINSDVKNELVAMGFNPNNVIIIPPGIAVKEIGEYSSENKDFDAVFVGRLNENKGIFDLIKIWIEVNKLSKNNYRLAIIGGGDQSCLHEKIAKSNLTESITVFGFLESIKMYEVMGRSNIFVFPSREEGFGISVAEAMSMGLPVVAWNLPVYKEYFMPGLCAIEKLDYKVFARKVIEISESKKLYETMAELGQQRVASLTKETCIENFKKEILLKI